MSKGDSIKILVIVNAVFGYDGISSVATNYYRYQNKSEVKMDLLTINAIPLELKEQIERDGNVAYVLPFRNRNPFKYIIKLKGIVAENRYDIVCVHGNSATMAVELFAAWMGGCRVRVAHSHNTQCDHQKLNRLLMPIFRRLYTNCCACSVEAGHFLFGERDCYIVNNGIEVQKYFFDEEVRNSLRSKYSLSDKIVLGHIGRFTYQKNQEFLIMILDALVKEGHDVVLLLVGEGVDRTKIKDLACEKGVADRVIFYGTTNHINEVLQMMDCFVFPSRFEGLGIAAIEAQASGLACVASEQVPRKMKVDDRTVFLSLESDLKEWCAAILNRLSSPKDRKERMDKIHNHLKKAGYDIRENCADMLMYYHKIVDRKG